MPTLPPGVKGIYALGPSTGIGEQGLYLPDQFPLDDLNRYQGTSAWRDVVVSGNESLNFKVRYGMKQLSLSLSTNIDNAQLVDDLANPTLHILNPVIDQVHNIMTFYVAENSIFTADSHKNRTDQLCYLKASAALMGYPGVHEIAGVWYGNYNYDNQLGTYVSTQDGTHVQINVTLFDYGTFDPKHFYVDTAHSSTYSLGYHASFFYVANDSDTSVFLPSTIQNSFGPYDLENNIYAQDGTLADSVDEHAGMIRVFSEAYVFNPENPMEDPMTFRDYKVRIVRLREASFTALGAVTVDGIDALPETIPDVEDITISAPINFKPVANTSIGKMILTYVTENVAFGAVPHTLIQLLDQNQNVLGMTGRYSITPVNKQTIGNRDAVTGLWNPSTMEYTFTINQALPAGNYTLKITVDPERIYLVKFSKKMSTDAILTLTSTSHAIVQSGNDFSTDIPYGLFYNPEDPDVNATRIVNFTNLESVQNIAAEALNYPSVRPDYLTGMVLSNFATLVSTAFSMNLIEDEDEGYIRHEYVITYVVRPEEGPDITYTHTITEGVVPPELSASFLGVNPIIPVTGTLAFKRADPPPSYRFEYALSTVYRFGNVGLISKFTYSGEGSPFLGVHYAMATENNGFKIDIYSVSPVGFYQIAFSYVNERAFSGIDNPLDGQTLLWDFDFQSVLIEKQGSNVSRLENILFATDAAYEGMNTILHTSIMNEDLYVYLDENPDQRVIQWAPTFDIQYPEGDTSRLYYAIGQVADTDLTYYRPNFTLPEGAWIKRIVTVDNQEMIVDELFADFSPLIENEFRYVHYRIFAEDYNEEYLPNSTYSTDYWVAVQDVTNNIYLEVEINMNADIPLPITFLTLILTNEEGDVTRMSLFSEFQVGVILGTNLPFRPTSSGVVQVFMDLPKAYVFTVTFNRTLQSGPGFTIPGSIIPRMYTVVIDIDDQIGSQEWGQQEIVPFRP